MIPRWLRAWLVDGAFSRSPSYEVRLSGTVSYVCYDVKYRASYIKAHALVSREVFATVLESSGGKFYLSLLISSNLLHRLSAVLGVSNMLKSFEAYLFNAVFDEVADHSRDPGLSNTHHSANSLVLDSRIPLWLEYVESTSSCYSEALDC